GGDVTAKGLLSQRQDTIVARGVKTAPTMVVFDDGNAILKRLTFDQPTAWLATQLTRDPDLWDRHWVIAQLGQHATDPAAGAALAQGATGADYFLTRVAAASALAAFPAAVALPALASRGSNRALNLLAGHLDDERPYVRRWTLDAFRFSLRRDLAQTTLQAVSGELKFADTRRATVDLLQQWQKGRDQNP